MNTVLTQERFAFVQAHDKSFISAFDYEMKNLGFDFGGDIGSGYCWGKYMIVYKKTGVKNSKSYARIYIRENGIVLRMYFSDVDAHYEYIEKAPDHIQDAFIRQHGTCNHCHNQESDGTCGHRKTYTLLDRLYEKCDGFTFEFNKVDVSKLMDYIKLFTEFYPPRKKKSA